jgi:digeranylgeranylglycerophospholipid reductase
VKLLEISTDIVVVGGGPAGLSAAYSAAKVGAKVIVLEKDEAIAHSVRTSGVSWIDSMQALGIPDSLYNPVSSFSFVSPNNEVRISGSKPLSCVLDVRSTYQHLASLAASAGAEIIVRGNVSGVITKDGGRIAGVKASTPRGDLSISSTLAIDASGFGSSIARRAGLAREWRRFGVGAEYECYCSDIDSTTWTLLVGARYSPAGYAWIFPLSANRVRIGVGVGRPEASADPVAILHEIISKRPGPLAGIRTIQPLEFHYGSIPNEGVRQQSVWDGLMVVGDSAGQANPLVLEGIRYAIEFGRLAGDVGARSLGQGSTKESLLEYDSAWRKKAESKIKSALKVQERWLGLSDGDWDKEIEILHDMSPDEFIDFIKAEFTASKMMKLAIKHPKLAARQLFGMVLKN